MTDAPTRRLLNKILAASEPPPYEEEGNEDLIGPTEPH